MYYRDLQPAHVNADYGEYGITVRIEDGVVEGSFPAERSATSWNGTRSTAKSSGTTGSAPAARSPSFPSIP
jgi:hypothetical protein